MSKKKFIILIVVAVVGVICIALGASYALFTFNVTKNSNFKTVVGKLELSISDTNTEDRIVMNNAVPKKDSVALEEDGYTFTVTNTGSIDAFYTIYLDDIIPTGETKTRIANNLMHVNLSTSSTADSSNSKLVSALNGGVLTTGTLSAGDSINYTLRLWLDYNAGNEAQNKYFASRIRIDSTQESSVTYNTIDKVLAKFKPSELKEAIACDDNNGEYDNCSIYESIDEAIASRDTGLIVLTDDITRTSTINITSEKDVTLDLNGRTITSTANTITNIGKLTIDSSKSGGLIESTGNNTKTISSSNSAAKLVIKNGYIKGTDNCDTWSCSPLYVVNSSYLEITPRVETILTLNDEYIDGVYVKSGFGIGVWVASSSTGTINGGTYNILKTGTSNPWQHLVCSNCNTLTINDATVTGYGVAIRNQGTGNIIVNGGNYKSVGNQNIATDGTATGTITVNDGTFILPPENTGVNIRNAGEGTITLNGGYYESTGYTVALASTAAGKININGGTFISNSNTAIANQSTEKINITQTDKPIYITSLAQELKPVIVNSSTGIINITANQANKCTSNASDTTSGLCVYAEGNVNATDNARNVAVQNKSSGTININGGTYYGGSQGLNNNYSSEPYGIINIKNAKIISDRGVVNTYGGTINICNCIFDNIRYNIYNYSTGTINYNNVTFSNGTTTPVSGEIYNPTGTVTEVATCPISE